MEDFFDSGMRLFNHFFFGGELFKEFDHHHYSSWQEDEWEEEKASQARVEAKVASEKKRTQRAYRKTKGFIDKYYKKYSKLQNELAVGIKDFPSKDKPSLDNLVNHLLSTEGENQNQDTLLALKYLFKEHELFKKYAPKIENKIIKTNEKAVFLFWTYNKIFDFEALFDAHSKEFRKNSIYGKPAYFIWVSENLEKLYREDPKIIKKISYRINKIDKKETKGFKRLIRKLNEESIKRFPLVTEYIFADSESLPTPDWINKINLYSLGKLTIKKF